MMSGMAIGPGTSASQRERADPRGGGGADEQLALGADVEQPGAERERHRERGPDERRGAAERRVDAIGAAEHAPQQRPVGLEGVAADQQDDDARHERARGGWRRRDEHRLELDRLRAARAQTGRRRRPAVGRSASRSSGDRLGPVAAGHVAGRCCRGWPRPGRRCRRACRGRSRRCGRRGSSTSSSSADTSSTAAPWSRISMIRRWMNSIEPTSRPRVGWATTRSFTSPVSSRAMITFCWLPPERLRPGTLGLGRADVELARPASSAWRCDGVVVAQPAAGERAPPVAVEHEVVGDRERADDTVLAAVLGHVADAEVDDLPGAGVGDVATRRSPRRPSASAASP